MESSEVTLKKSSPRPIWGLLLFIFALFISVLIFSWKVVQRNSGGDQGHGWLGQVVSMGGSNDPKARKGAIGVIKLEGVILDSRKVIEELHVAEEDDDIKVIILRVESPGGAVGPTQEIYDEIIRVDSIKPVYASFGAIAASGGYYIGAATREIFCNRGAITGSIGVIMQMADLSRLYEWAKVSITPLKAGHFKDAGDPSRPLTATEKGLFEGMLANVHEQFKQDIMKRRSKKIKGSIDDIAQGQVFSGEQALKLGLVDHLMGLWPAARHLHEKHKLGGEFGIRFVKTKRQFELSMLLDGMEETFKNLNYGVRTYLPFVL